MRNYSLRKTTDVEISIPVTKVLLVALLLLPFTILTTKGQHTDLPSDGNTPAEAAIQERNVYRIHINAKGQILAENTALIPFDDLQSELREFILNYGKNPELSDSPTDAIVALKIERGVKKERYDEVLEIIQGVYYDIYAERAGITTQQYCQLDLANPEMKSLHDLGKKDIPMNISIANLNIP